MGRFIIKLHDEGTDYYLEWSTVVDAPVTYGLTRQEFEEYYRKQYGQVGMDGLADRMTRVDRVGTSSCLSWHKSADDHLSGNRAGPDETEATRDEILARYCRKRIG